MLVKSKKQLHPNMHEMRTDVGDHHKTTTPSYLIVTISAMAAVIFIAIVVFFWYYCRRRRKNTSETLHETSLLSSAKNHEHRRRFSLHTPKCQRGSLHTLRPSHSLHGQHLQVHSPRSGHVKHREGSTSELSKKVHMLTRTISNRLLPSVDAIPPVHDLVHPVLQQPVLEQPQEDMTAMQDDTCGSAMFGLGKLCFSVTYIEKVEMLHVNIQRAIHLPLHSARKFVNPYVKVKIVPPGTVKYVTKIHKHSPNPHFQESFVFRVPSDEIQDQVLRMTLYDHCRVTSDVVVGHVNFNLRDISRFLGSHSRDPIWREIETDEMSHPYRGELSLTLSYDHDQHRLTLGVVEGRKIQLSDGSTPTGVYTKISILVAEQVWKSKRTKTDKSHLGQPVFNEEFCMKVTPSDINHVNVMIAVYGKTSFSHCELIGRTSIGNYSYTTGQGLDQWMDMLTSPKQAAPMWHILS